MTRSTPTRRAASSTVHVPRTLVSKVAVGERSAVPTSVWAARWNTVSTSYSARARSTTAASRTSPQTTSTRASVPSSAKAESAGSSRRRTATRASRASSAFTSHEPRSPWAPVTKQEVTLRVRSRPQLPGRPPLRPQVVEQHRVLVGVHAVPEARVPVGPQLPVGGQPLQGLALQDAGVIHVVEDAGLEAEEPAVDPVLGAGLLPEAGHPMAAVELHDAELQVRAH